MSETATTLSVMTNRTTKRVCILGSQDDGVMAHNTFEMDMDLAAAKKMHKDLEKAIAKLQE